MSPRPGPRRPVLGLRLSDEDRKYIEGLAERETDGNLSEMIRRLLAEAVTARQKTAS